MADVPQSLTTLGSGGLNSLLRFLATLFIQAARNRGNPLAGMTNVSDAVATKGQTVGVPVAPTIASRLLTDGSAKVLDDDAGTTVDVTLNKHRYSAFARTLISSALEGNATALMQLQSRITGVLNGVEEDVLSLVTAGLTSNVAGTYNTSLTEANIAAGLSSLYSQKVPEGDVLLGLIHPDAHAWGALSQIANFVQAHGQNQPWATATPDLLRNGYFWNGVMWRMCNAIPKNGTSIDNCVLHPATICVAMRALEAPIPGTGASSVTVSDPVSGVTLQIIYQWDKDRLANEIVVHLLYGAAIVKEPWGLLLKS